MNCPQCKSEQSKVIDSRLTDSGNAKRRRRECLKCGHRYTTYESGEAPTVWTPQLADLEQRLLALWSDLYKIKQANTPMADPVKAEEAAMVTDTDKAA